MFYNLVGSVFAFILHIQKLLYWVNLDTIYLKEGFGGTKKI
jgi:hypothetical protein